MPEQEETGQGQTPKKGCLGCSFPLIIGILVVFLVLFVVGFIAGPLGKSMFGDLGLPSWLSVPQPHPELPAEGVFHIFGFAITNSIIAAWLTIIVLVAFSYAATRRLKLIPTRLQNAFEFALESLLKSCAADSIIACLSGFISIPNIIFVFMFASICLGIKEGSCVIAVNPILNFLPSRAIVLNMLLPFSKTSFPKTLGASSKTMLITGLFLSSPVVL